MQWSQLKRRIEDQFAPSLHGRLEIRYTVYRTLTEGDGRLCFTWDGEQLYSLEDMPAQWRMDARVRRWKEQGIDATENEETGSFTGAREFLATLHDYLRTPFDDLLHSPDPLERALALADRRLGRRRFEKLSPQEFSHPLLQRFYALRATAEGWRIAPEA